MQYFNSLTQITIIDYYGFADTIVWFNLLDAPGFPDSVFHTEEVCVEANTEFTERA